MTNDRPGPDPRMTDDELLSIFDWYDEPALTTKMVTKKTPFTERGTRRRLDQLEAEGRVDSMRVGRNAKVWWRADRD